MVMVDSDCTTNDHTAALQCTGVPPLNNDIEKDYAKVVQDACRSAQSLNVSGCIDDIAESQRCRDDPDFNMMVDKDTLLDLHEYFCSNSEVYLESGSCIGQQYDEATSCSQWALDRLMSLEGTKLTPNETMIEWCGYLYEYRTCYTTLVEINCGSEASDFLFYWWIRTFGFCQVFVPEETTTISTNPEHSKSSVSASTKTDTPSLTYVSRVVTLYTTGEITTIHTAGNVTTTIQNMSNGHEDKGVNIHFIIQFLCVTQVVMFYFCLFI